MRNKRLLSFLLCVLLIGALLPVRADAAYVVYQPTEVSGLYVTTVSDGKSHVITAIDHSGSEVTGAVTSCSSSDTSVVSVKVQNGKCVAVSKKAGFATLKIKSANWTCEVECYSQFRDVADKSEYFWEPVRWALKKGVTTGTTDSTFAPYDPCFRGQAVTFMWKIYGDYSYPAGAVNPFDDVVKGDDCYYYYPVLWANAYGITTGTTPTTFSPFRSCTRGQIITFIYRANNLPG